MNKGPARGRESSASRMRLLPQSFPIDDVDPVTVIRIDRLEAAGGQFRKHRGLSNA
jgi:hypothetical protein